ncbi:MAG: bifunctional glutamate N-acetyltransferase/amino-acid acetyltransferase ArgJ [Oscillospiraceae bacterium]|nr:bifunctional glutamate N-acetyltransferase/amino-acid acetyltransferase ArgJ [Oscillospiraceae bacterium]
MKEFKGFAFVEGGVCAAKGFRAGGIHCGLAHKALTEDAPAAPVQGKQKNDLAIICADKPCTAAAMYTTNKVQGAPIAVTRRHLSDGRAQAVIVNSVNANTCNADGAQKAERMCKAAADALGLAPEDIIVASTGVIGQPLPIEPIEQAVPELAQSLSEHGNAAAVEAIMTTDTRPKEAAVEFSLGGVTCRIGGMLKGSGMIHPNMATTLTFLTTDCEIAPGLLQQALRDVVGLTLNRVSVDGDTSTNDMVCILAGDGAGNEPVHSEGEAYDTFRDALYAVLMNLARMMARDGEGATKLIECLTDGAADDRTAEIVAKSVITSSLFKAAVFGEDANWGRILCAVGYAPAEFDISRVDVTLASAGGSILVCKNGAGVDFSEALAKQILSEEEILVHVTIGDGIGTAVCWGCDLTYDYVRINGDYRS